MSKELREEILKGGNVRKASITFSKKLYSNGTESPLGVKNQDIVEIGIDDLLALFDRYAAEREKQARIDELERIIAAYDMSGALFFTQNDNKETTNLADRLSVLKETTNE